jgi:hypothetical protein
MRQKNEAPAVATDRGTEQNIGVGTSYSLKERRERERATKLKRKLRRLTKNAPPPQPVVCYDEEYYFHPRGGRHRVNHVSNITTSIFIRKHLTKLYGSEVVERQTVIAETEKLQQLGGGT